MQSKRGERTRNGNEKYGVTTIIAIAIPRYLDYIEPVTLINACE